MEKMPLVVGYARVSSREQAVDSHALEQQIARLELAGATKIFKDIQSGNRDDRPELNELMNLVHKREVDEVVITRIDRLARSLPKLRACIDIYQEAGVNLRILDQLIDLNTSQGKLMANVLGSLAEWETDLLSERILHGKQHRRNQKKACESSPWGYRVIHDKYELDNRPFLCLLENRPANYLDLYNEAPDKLPGLTVKEIGRDCIDIFFQERGVSRAVRAIFTKYGIAKSSAHKNGLDGIFHWTPTGFNRWLTNPVLCGHTVYSKKMTTGKGKRKLNDPANWQIIQNTHPAHQLLTDEEALEIKQIIKFNTRIENLKDKTRQQIEEEINPFVSNSLLNKTAEELIRAGNNLAIWHTLLNDDKVKIYHKLVQRITIRNGEVESVILKISV